MELKYYYTTDANGGFLGYINAVSKEAAISLWNKQYQTKAFGAVETIDPSLDIGGKDWR
jgi:hypothetical protein